MKSMTGFGQASGSISGQACSIEIRSVNHRYLDVKLRLPEGWDGPSIEQSFSQMIRAKLKRGSVHVSVQFQKKHPGENIPSLNLPLSQHYLHLYRQLVQEQSQTQAKKPLSNEILESHFMTSSMLTWVLEKPGVISFHPEPAIQKETESLLPLFSLALDSLVLQREREGNSLSAALFKNCDVLLSHVDNIETQSAHIPESYKEHLERQLQAWLSKHDDMVDPGRLAQEVALLASRVDIHEELVRVKIHIAEAKRLCSQEESGRQLDFLSQEIHRELNTIGSKSQSANISSQVISMKAELERMREQIQNVE